MLSRNPKLRHNTQKRLIHFGLMDVRSARKTKGNESILEFEIELVDPQKTSKGVNSTIGNLVEGFVGLKHVL